MEITTELAGPGVLVVRLEGMRTGDRYHLMLSGDRHHDNIKARWDLEKIDLELARDIGAGIMDVGDLYCAMQGKYDPRSNMDEIRPEHVGKNYLDRLVETAADFYSPYRENFQFLLHGNHEAEVLKRHGHDITQELANKLSTDNHRVYASGGVGGWIIFQFTYHKTSRTRRVMYAIHGSGGGGPVTRGTIQTNRQSVYIDADIVVNGHTHDAWTLGIARMWVNQKFKILRRYMHFMRTPGYKDDFGIGVSGWANEKWMAPKPMGAAWLTFEATNDGIEISTEVKLR